MQWAWSRCQNSLQVVEAPIIHQALKATAVGLCIRQSQLSSEHGHLEDLLNTDIFHMDLFPTQRIRSLQRLMCSTFLPSQWINPNSDTVAPMVTKQTVSSPRNGCWVQGQKKLGGKKKKGKRKEKIQYYCFLQAEPPSLKYSIGTEI